MRQHEFEIVLDFVQLHVADPVKDLCDLLPCGRIRQQEPGAFKDGVLFCFEPVIRQLQDYMQSLTDQDTDLWFEHHQKMTEFLWNHKQELYILIYGSKGTVYEDVWSQLKQQIEERYFRALKTGRDHSSLIHVLTMMQMYGYVTILSQDYTLEETMRLLEQIEKYRYGGLDALMKQTKTNG